jgi:hypothetical protein
MSLGLGPVVQYIPYKNLRVVGFSTSKLLRKLRKIAMHEIGASTGEDLNTGFEYSI